MFLRTDILFEFPRHGCYRLDLTADEGLSGGVFSYNIEVLPHTHAANSRGAVMQSPELGLGTGPANGVTVKVHFAPGWVMYKAGEPAPPIEHLALALISNVQHDLAKNAKLRMHTLVPIVRDGNTVGLVMGYEALPE